MKPCRIVDAFGNGLAALAVPFSYGEGDDERYVVLAFVAPGRRSIAESEFFAVLESLTIPQAVAAARYPQEIPLTPTDPLIVGLALCKSVYGRISRSLKRRGWPIENVHSIGDLWQVLRESRPDIVMVDADELSDPVATITSIHRMAKRVSIRLLVFRSRKSTGLDGSPLVDAVLDHEIDAETAFRTFKNLARATADLRRTNLYRAGLMMDKRARDALSLEELAEFGAVHAAEVFRGWAYVALLNDFGAVSRAEHPRFPSRVLSTLPAGVLSDGPRFELKVGEAFFDELTQHPSDRFSLASLQPRSGAIVPIVAGGRRCGILVACSQDNWADSTTFEALSRLAAILGARFEGLATADRLVPEFRREDFWERLRDRSFGLDVYRSNGCSTPWHYRRLDGTNGLLTMGLQDDRALCQAVSETRADGDVGMARILARSTPKAKRFAGLIDFSRQEMNYAANGFTPPVALDVNGPSGSVANLGDVVTGVTMLTGSSRALICDDTLWRWCRGRSSEGLVAVIESERPSGMASIVSLV